MEDRIVPSKVVGRDNEFPFEVDEQGLSFEPRVTGVLRFADAIPSPDE